MRTQPVSPRTAAVHSRYRDAQTRHGVCPYCAIGCGLEYHLREGALVGVEGNAQSPVNRGRLCPKGANTLQLLHNPHRVTKVRYRAPFAREWEERPLDWALGRIAELVKATRDEGFIEHDANGLRVNNCATIASLGGSACDNEENYLMKKLLTGGLGIVATENQARL